ncbi:MAG TPA: phosphoribosylanthranilate isomerase [Candidatus Acidoferrum sp.]|nr:phosphoribosylanthranilate isomerase [Candidatus Acidoferrum sp.]
MVLVKICGITNGPDARAACEAGANLLGFNFYEKSPRHITSADASKIRAQLPQSVEAVGIFVNAKPAAVASLCSSLRLDAAQLHGDETPPTVAEVARAIRVFKAFRVDPDFSLAALDEYPDAYALLFDAAYAGQYGGTGRMTDWALARRAALSRRIILAGGLKVENVAVAIRLVRPFAVDVASGVESKPGKKDHGRLREFIQEVRRAERQREEQPESSRES